MVYLELEPSGKRKRYLLRTPEGVELTLSALRRDLAILFDPDKVDFEITPSGGYRFFAKEETALESAPDKAAASSAP